ncbi:MULTISPECIES: BppU family phage baseplate upper protein [unclassified Enterococcus]|uniref:BppU family phage baseplate upper protein n=1 Tax=unclassified Enterococcus TaxID=2608891 RepID=UPI001F1497EA|nr:MULTISPECIES: BppU family phage baseplate upper protein [unclassified Enterococcus]
MANLEIKLSANKRQPYVRHRVVGRVGDGGLTTINVQLLEADEVTPFVIDPSGSLKFIAQNSIGKFTDGFPTIVDATNGLITYTFSKENFSVSNKFKNAYFEYTDLNNQKVTFQDFIVDVLPRADISAEQAQYYVSTLEKLLEQFNTKFEHFLEESSLDYQTLYTKYNELVALINSIDKNVTALDEKIKEADQYFVAKESVEVGPLIFKNTTVTTQDWNDITESGIYYCAAATGANMPYTGKLYGFLTVYNELAVIIQKYEFQGAIYMRTLAGNPVSWGSWKKIAISSEVMNLNDPQSSFGLKNFIDGIQINGKDIRTKYSTSWTKLEIIGKATSNYFYARRDGDIINFSGQLMIEPINSWSENVIGNLKSEFHVAVIPGLNNITWDAISEDGKTHALARITKDGKLAIMQTYGDTTAAKNYWISRSFPAAISYE